MLTISTRVRPISTHLLVLTRVWIWVKCILTPAYNYIHLLTGSTTILLTLVSQVFRSDILNRNLRLRKATIVVGPAVMPKHITSTVYRHRGLITVSLQQALSLRFSTVRVL